MSTPGQPRRRRPDVLLVGGLVAVLAVSGVVVATRRAPTDRSPSPAASTATSAPPAQASPTRTVGAVARVPVLPGVGRGQLYAQTATAIYRVDLRTGSVHRTPTPALEQFSSFVAGPGWVVFKTVDNDTGVVVRDGQPARPLPRGLTPNGRLDPGPDGDLWLQPEEPTGGVSVVTRVDLDGRPVSGETIEVPGTRGTLGADGTGFLLLETPAGGVYQARPAGLRRLSPGVLLATGPRHLLSYECDERARCAAVRLDRRTGVRTTLPQVQRALTAMLDGAEPSDGDGAGDVSSSGRWATMEAPDGQGAGRLHVIDLTTGHDHLLPGRLTDMNPNTQQAWSANGRWLFADTDHQVRAFDTTTGQTQILDLTGDQILHLTMVGASGN